MRTLYYSLAFLVSNVFLGISSTYLRSESSAVKQFNDFSIQYDRDYEVGSDEYNMRFDIFNQNLKFIESENSKGTNTWTLGINKFADLTNDEFKTLNSGCYKSHPRAKMLGMPQIDIDSYPTEIDWVSAGAVTPVKNQGNCGSCWAFSSTGSIEGAYYLKNKNLVSFSEQELVDCSSSSGNQGCNGGFMDNSFKWLEQNSLCSESEYPYKARNGKCKSTCQGLTKVSQYVDVLSNHEASLLAAVAITPVSVAIEADQQVFQFYTSGVISSSAGCSTNLDHGVLVVGYGVDANSGLAYWKVKNSWGADWGDAGYVLLERNVNTTLGNPGTCGIAMEPSYPILA